MACEELIDQIGLDDVSGEFSIDELLGSNQDELSADDLVDELD